MTSTGDPTVREALAADAARVAQVHVDAWRETYSAVLADHHFSDAVLSRRREFWAGYLSLAERPGRMVVAERGGVVVGFANAGDAVGPDAEHGFPPVRPLQLFSIYLLAAAHGSGLGQSMLDAVIGDQPAQLWVLQGNDRAIAFYRRNGFESDGIEFIEPSDPRMIELRMVR
ncbi:MAG: GNAT family N-acetyltransferase [Pseudolysinimonas sp.]